MTRPLGVLLVVALAVSACGGAASDVPETADPALVIEGSELYQASCAECHGADLRGTDRGPSHLSEVYEPNHHGDAAFLLAVQRGVRAHHWNFGNMAPISGLTADDVAAIVAYVRAEQQNQGFEPYPP